MKRTFVCALMALFAFTAFAQELNVASVNVRLLVYISKFFNTM